MKIDSSIVGTKLNERRYEVSFRDVTNYAAAVDDMNPLYYDDTKADRLIAPPVFPVVLTWPMVLGLGEQLASRFSPEVLASLVHSSEHILWHRPLRPGNRIRIEGRIEAVVPRFAGTQVVIRLEATTGKDQARLFTEYTGGLLRGVGCVDEGLGAENLPRTLIAKDDLVPLWKRDVDIPLRTPFLYDGCTRIEFPIHTSRAFARGVGLPDFILQGTVTLAIAIREMIDHEAHGNALSVKEIGCRFSNVVVPGSGISVQLMARHEGDTGRHLTFRVVNASGKQAIREGYVRLAPEATGNAS